MKHIRYFENNYDATTDEFVLHIYFRVVRCRALVGRHYVINRAHPARRASCYEFWLFLERLLRSRLRMLTKLIRTRKKRVPIIARSF